MVTSWNQKNVYALYKMMRGLSVGHQLSRAVSCSSNIWTVRVSRVRSWRRCLVSQYWVLKWCTESLHGLWATLCQKDLVVSIQVHSLLLRTSLKKVINQKLNQWLQSIRLICHIPTVAKDARTMTIEPAPSGKHSRLISVATLPLATSSELTQTQMSHLAFWSTQLKPIIMWYEAQTKRKSCTAATATKGLELCRTWLRSRTHFYCSCKLVSLLLC